MQQSLPDAINAAFPETTMQACIVHLVRHSLNFYGWKDRKVVAKDLKRIYQATDDTEAENGLLRETSLSYTPNGSTNDPSKLHGLKLIHRVSDTPLRLARTSIVLGPMADKGHVLI